MRAACGLRSAAIERKRAAAAVAPDSLSLKTASLMKERLLLSMSSARS